MPNSLQPAAGTGPASARIRPDLLQSPGAFLGAGLLLVVAGWLVHAVAADAAWMLSVHAQAAGPEAIIAWSCITVAGLGWSALVVLLATDRGHGALAALLLPTFVVGGLLTHIPKHLLAVPRPAATSLASHLHVVGHAFTGPVSMPSGHALTAAATAALLCIVAARGILARSLILLAAAVVAWSRVVVGAHWPSDVLVGAGLGLLAASVVATAAASARTGGWHAWLAGRLSTPTGQRWLAAAECGAALGLLSGRTGYPAGTPMVWLLASLALASATLRWRATRSPARAPRAQDAPAGLS